MIAVVVAAAVFAAAVFVTSTEKFSQLAVQGTMDGEKPLSQVEEIKKARFS